MSPMYGFRCDNCGSTSSEYFPIQDGPSPFPHEDCGTYQRIWTVPAIKTPYPAHFNYSVGAFVNSEREFNDHLKRGAE